MAVPDPTFGWRSACVAHVSGWGGIPFAMVRGRDNRPTVLCLAGAQTDATVAAASPQMVAAGQRFREAPIPTLRVVSLPIDGRLAGTNANSLEYCFGAPAEHPISVIRVLAGAGRFAVLGTTGPRQSQCLWFFREDPRPNVSGWTLEATHVLRTQIPPSQMFRGVALGWATTPPGLLLAARVPVAGEQTPTLGLWFFDDQRPGQIAESSQIVTPPLGVGLPANLTIELHVLDILAMADDTLRLALTWNGLASAGPINSSIVQDSRAGVLSVRRHGMRPDPRAWVVDPQFGDRGCWLAPRASTVNGAPSGVLATTAHALAQDPRGLIVGGRASAGNERGLYVAWLSADGVEQRSAFPCHGVVTPPAGLVVDRAGRVSIGGSTGVPSNQDSDPTKSIVARLSANGTPDTAFGSNGTTEVRMHGGTHLGALITDGRDGLFMAASVRSGWTGSAHVQHLCVAKLTSRGTIDSAFGSVGVARHDGLGTTDEAMTPFTCTVAPDGAVWSAGIAPNYALALRGHPATRGTPYVGLLTCARMTARGELDPAFGFGGIVQINLSSLLPDPANAQPGNPANLPPIPRFDVDSIVPLADRGVMIAGTWWRYEGTTHLAGTPPPYQAIGEGGWLARLNAAGALTWLVDLSSPAPGGPRVALMRDQLANGHVQGIEAGSIVRFDPAASAGNARVPGFGPGAYPLPPGAVWLPNRVRPDGSFIALRHGPFKPNSTGGQSESIGLVRFRADGTPDPAFGTGGVNQPAGADCIGLGELNVVDPVLNIDDEVLGLTNGARLAFFDTVEVSEGFVTVASVRTQESTPDRRIFMPTSILLLRWNASGKPLPVMAWGGRSVQILRYMVGGLRLGNEWLTWRPTGAVLLADGSIAIALECADFRQFNALPGGPSVDPASLPIMPGICRLIAPDYTLDTSMGGGFVAIDVPGRDFRTRAGQAPSQHVRELQSPVSIRALADGSIVCAVRLLSVAPPGGNVGGFIQSMPPERQWFDGSIAALRFV